MIPTKSELVARFHDCSDQWHQRWSTFIGFRGDVYLCCRNGDEYRHYWPLDGLIASRHDIEQLRRVDWYAFREEGDDSMTLYRFEPGGEVQIEGPGPVRDEFLGLFRGHGGEILRPSEAIAAEREADDVRSAEVVTR